MLLAEGCEFIKSHFGRSKPVSMYERCKEAIKLVLISENWYILRIVKLYKFSEFRESDDSFTFKTPHLVKPTLNILF